MRGYLIFNTFVSLCQLANCVMKHNLLEILSYKTVLNFSLSDSGHKYTLTFVILLL